MALLGQSCRLRPRLDGRPAVQACGTFWQYNQRHQGMRLVHELGSSMDHPPNESILGTDDFETCYERAQPMSNVNHFGPRNAREKVFGASGKSRHLVWEYRATDQDVIVVKNEPVYADWDRQAQAPAGNLRGLLC